jgi:hypothetical protein
MIEITPKDLLGFFDLIGRCETNARRARLPHPKQCSHRSSCVGPDRIGKMGLFEIGGRSDLTYVLWYTPVDSLGHLQCNGVR